jgi:hypothetical protein
VEYTGAVGTAPSLNSSQMNGPFDATPPSSARLFFADGSGRRDRRDGDGIDGVKAVRGVSWELDLCLGQDDFDGDSETERRAGLRANVGAKSGDGNSWVSTGGGSGDVTDDRTPIEEMTRRMLLESKKHEKT